VPLALKIPAIRDVGERAVAVVVKEIFSADEAGPGRGTITLL